MSHQKTLILGKEDIERTMALADYVSAVEIAFRNLAARRMRVPEVVHIPAPDGAFHIKSAAYVDEPAYVAVKVNGNFPHNLERRALPTIQGAIVLCDGRDGRLLAIIDSIEVTAMRTGAATAVAAKYLARKDSAVATIIGCGVQGRVQLLSLAEVLPLKTVFAVDTDSLREAGFVEQMRAQTGLDVRSAGDFSRACGESDVIAACTSARKPYLDVKHVSPGTFIAAVGADNDDKQELTAELMARSRVVVDIEEQCAKFGELHHALAQGAMQRSDVAGNLPSIVARRKRFSRDDVVVFDSTGSAIQDVAAAGIIYERALRAQIGISMSFA